MTYIPNPLPKLWWLKPWQHVRRLHAALTKAENDIRFGALLADSMQHSNVGLRRERDAAREALTRLRHKTAKPAKQKTKRK